MAKVIKWSAGHFALYGNTVLPYIKCPYCKELNPVIKGKIVCCDREVANELIKITRIKRYSLATEHRRHIPKSLKEEILDLQNNTCLYCLENLETYVIKMTPSGKVRKIYLKIEFDHLVPYSYSANNKNYNFAAACQVCNRIKSNLMFSTLEQAREYILLRRKEKGYL